MKTRTWIMTGTVCFLAVALMGGLSPLAAQEREDEERPSAQEAQPAPAPGATEQDSFDRQPADRQGTREAQNGQAVLGVFLGPSPTTGARIQSVESQSAAAQAGLRAGDFILSINDTKIGRPEDVQQAMAGLEPGTEAALTIWRNGQTHEMNVMLGQRRVAGFRGAAGDRPAEGGREASTVLGMTLAETEDGLRIESVTPDGPAARAELRAGDIIKGIDSDTVARRSDLINGMRQHTAGDDVWLSIVRGEEEHAVKVTMADRQQFSQTEGNRTFQGQAQGGWLGMTLNQADQGVRIQNVAPNGPAAESELRAGDIITGIESDAVSRVADLMTALREFSSGDDVWLSILRDDEEHAVKVTMADRPQSGSTGTREFRGFRGDFAGEGRLMEEHQRLRERIERLEAEVQALRSRLGEGTPDQQPQREQPQREE